MRKVIFITLILLIIASLPCIAQYETDDKDRYSISMGVFRPSDATLRDVSSVWIAPTLQYFLSFDKQERPTRMVTLAMYGEDKDTLSVNSTKICYDILRYRSDEEKGWYYGGGVDIAMLKAKITFGGKVSSIRPGAQLIGGYNISQHYYAEYRYEWLPSWRGINWSGSALYIGGRASF